jgi:hypothetical protein
LPALAEFIALHREADTPDAFVAEIANALAAPTAVPVDDPVLTSHTWEVRLDAMLARIATSRTTSAASAAPGTG